MIHTEYIKNFQKLQNNLRTQLTLETISVVSTLDKSTGAYFTSFLALVLEVAVSEN